MARIGIFSGTFDPVHNGHLAFALAAVQAGLVARVVFLPEPKPRAKQQVTPLPHRSAMLRQALVSYPTLESLELNGDRFSAVETLPQLADLFPGDQLSLLLGSDVVETFAYRWPGLERLLGTMELLIAVRSRETRRQVEGQMRSLQQVYGGVTLRYSFVDVAKHSDVASSQIRDALGVMPALPPEVTGYINRHGLYASKAEASV
ncbi:MAG TPA: adenylyltransferase/cytidyltransferase family protein [Patescibacteria group bacterium]|nr:adenylyltransferase/cytidyltransferase family protein [Patescibacteria group bacterium]